MTFKYDPALQTGTLTIHICTQHASLQENAAQWTINSTTSYKLLENSPYTNLT